MYAANLYYNLCITSEYLGFSLQDELKSSATFNHILFCLSLYNLTHNQSQHIQPLQELTHAPQPYNMNATQSWISNQHIMAIISILNHKSDSHSINQHKPDHNSHTKNALRIHYTKSKSIHQNNNVIILELPWHISSRRTQIWNLLQSSRAWHHLTHKSS
jgi:hypothetical protein